MPPKEMEAFAQKLKEQIRAQQKDAGFYLAKGVFEFISRTLFIATPFVLAFILIRGLTGFGTDDTDVNGFNRSGLTIHLDAKTGVEYLSDGHGGLVVRQKGAPK